MREEDMVGTDMDRRRMVGWMDIWMVLWTDG